MAAPSVTARAGSQEAGPVTSHTVSLPATLNNGEYIVIMFACIGGAGQTVTWPAGWTGLAQGGLGGGGGVYLASAYREVTGTEGSTITVTTGTSVESVHRAIVSPCDTPLAGTIDTANDDSPTWNSLSVTSGDYRSLAMLSIGGAESPTGAPSGYGEEYSDDTGSGDLVVGYFWELAQTSVTSLAPSGVTLTAGERWATLVVGLPEASGSSHSLLADDVESASEVGSPSITQDHDLNATDVESSSEVSSPALTQVHGLTADDVESASEVSAPSLSESHSLTADDVESASEVSAPSIGQVHAITADDVESASEVGAPAITQAHAFTADDVESASEVSAPVLTVGADHNLLADDVESASEVSSPSLTQLHVLTANDVESASEVSNPSVDDGTVQPSEDQPTGGFGFINDYDAYRQRKRAEERRIRALLGEIQDPIDREIAQRLHEEPKEDRAAEIGEMVRARFSDQVVQDLEAYSDRVSKAFVRAYTQGNFSALEALDREMQRAIEEEEFLLLSLVMMDG